MSTPNFERLVDHVRAAGHGGFVRSLRTANRQGPPPFYVRGTGGAKLLVRHAREGEGPPRTLVAELYPGEGAPCVVVATSEGPTRSPSERGNTPRRSIRIPDDDWMWLMGQGEPSAVVRQLIADARARHPSR